MAGKLLRYGWKITMARQVINEEVFTRMACGNIAEFKGMAEEFLADLRRLMPGWAVAREQGKWEEVQSEIHRCKGGASLFGMEKLRVMLASLEKCEEAEFDAITKEVERTGESLASIL